MNRVLLVDDNKDIITANKKYLEKKGYIVHCAVNGDETLQELSGNEFDCLVLDVWLPDTNGFELCKEIRKSSNAPIIFLSCLSSEDNKVMGLMSGGDDYMTKPFSLKELEAHIYAQIRRNSQNSFSLNENDRILTSGESSVQLTNRELDLFKYLYEQQNEVISAQALYEKVWGEDESFDPNVIAVYIARLRKKLDKLTPPVGSVVTLSRKGYKFKPAVK